MTRVFIDTNIPMYAAGKAHPLRQPSQEVIRAVVDERVDAVTDAEVFQEILRRYWHINSKEQGLLVFEHFYRVMLGRILPVTALDVRLAFRLNADFPQLPPRDALHLAIMERHDIDAIVSADRHFDIVPGITRISAHAFTTFQE